MQENNVNNVNNKKSNKLLYVIIVILCIAVLGLGGFIIYDKMQDDKNSENSNNPASNSSETSNKKEDDSNSNSNTLVAKLDDTKDWVYDATYEKKVSAESYKTYSDTYYAKDIVVPYININSDYAKTANASIKKVFDSAIKMYNGGVKDKMTYVEQCNYKKYINENTLSVILTYAFGATDVPQPEYYTYNIDLKTGNQLSYKEVYSMAGFTDENIESKVVAAITKTMKKRMAEDASEDEQKNLNKYTNVSINNYKKSVSNNKVVYFLSDNKKLNVVVNLSIPVGTGEFDTIITVD